MSLQSQQARLATLYLPMFGLLQENVYRLDSKEAAPLSNHNVSLTPSGRKVNSSCFCYYWVNVRHRWCFLFSFYCDSSCPAKLAHFLSQNAREDSLVPNSMVTPQKPGSCIENALHKDVFGVISGTGKSSLQHVPLRST